MIPRVCDGDDCDYDERGVWQHFGDCERLEDGESEADYLVWAAYHLL